jgi:hypothetical protein
MLRNASIAPIFEKSVDHFCYASAPNQRLAEAFWRSAFKYGPITHNKAFRSGENLSSYQSRVLGFKF